MFRPNNIKQKCHISHHLRICLPLIRTQRELRKLISTNIQLRELIVLFWVLKFNLVKFRPRNNMKSNKNPSLTSLKTHKYLLFLRKSVNLLAKHQLSCQISKPIHSKRKGMSQKAKRRADNKSKQSSTKSWRNLRKKNKSIPTSSNPKMICNSTSLSMISVHSPKSGILVG